MSCSAAQLPFPSRPGTAVVGRTRSFQALATIARVPGEYQPGPGGCLSEKSELLIFLLIDLGQTALALSLLVMAGEFEPYMTENLVSIPLQER